MKSLVTLALMATSAVSARLPLQIIPSAGPDLAPIPAPGPFLSLPFLDGATIPSPPAPLASPDDEFPQQTPLPVMSDTYGPMSDAPTPAPSPETVPITERPLPVLSDATGSLDSPPPPSAFPCLGAISPTSPDSPAPSPTDSGSIFVLEDGSILSGPFAQAGGSGGRCHDFNTCEDNVWATCVPGWIPINPEGDMIAQQPTSDASVLQTRVNKLEQMLQKAVVALVNRDIKLDAKIAELDKQVALLHDATRALHLKLQGFEIPVVDVLGRSEEAAFVDTCLAIAFSPNQVPST